MKRIKYLVWGIVFLAGSVGGSWCTVNGYQRESGLETRGTTAIATIAKYEPSHVRRRRRGPLEIAHYHKVAYDGHQGTVELDRQYPTGTKLSVIYDGARPAVVRLNRGEDSVGWGIWDWTWRIGGILILLLAAFGGFVGAFEKKAPREPSL